MISLDGGNCVLLNIVYHSETRLSEERKIVVNPASRWLHVARQSVKHVKQIITKQTYEYSYLFTAGSHSLTDGMYRPQEVGIIWECL